MSKAKLVITAVVVEGRIQAEVARAYGVSVRSIERWLGRARRGEPLADRPRPGRPPKVAPAQRAALAAQAAARPDATLAQHCAAWAAAGGVRLGPSTMARELARLGLTRKKRP